jgi:arylsulfatase A-like enzyme/Tfp pilus assembly protein PilF
MRRTLAAAFVIVVAVLAWMLVTRARRPRLESAGCHGCNILLITIDTLRLDRVGAFGSTRNLTPELDRLAREGLTLTRAYAPAPLTLPSHTSILTAVSPPVHGVRANGLSRLGPKLPTLATVLKGAGYRTGAFVGAFVLDARFGLTRGFDVYDDRYGEKHEGDLTEGAERRAEDVIKPALAYIHRPAALSPQPSTPSSPQPWFVWIHLYDPHEPYDAPEPWRSQHEPYDAEVAYTDAMIGRLLDDLRASGQLAHTLVVAAADHGESLGEHNERTHGTFVYDVTMRVPWIIWAPGGIARGRYDGLVRLIDLAPTVVDLLDVAAPAEFEGASLAAQVRLKPDATTVTAYLEAMDANLTRNWAPLSAIVSGDEKLIDVPIPELYDLASDPGEANNVYSRDPARARTLESLLRDRRTMLEARAAGAEKTTLSAEARQRLQALGYTASSADPGQRRYTDADDPKALIGAANELNQALADFRRGPPGPAIETVRAIIRSHPGFSTAYGVLASMLHDSSHLAEATATLEQVVARGIADQSTFVVLAGYLVEGGMPQQAVDLLDVVIAAHPDYVDAYNSLGVAYSRLGRHDRARLMFRRVLELDPTSATAYENLGVDEIAADNAAAAVADLSHALELDPRLARAHNVLATAYMRQHREGDAFAQWQAALALDPKLYDALYNLGISLWDSGRQADARPYLEQFVRDAPPRYAADVGRVRRLIGR